MIHVAYRLWGGEGFYAKMCGTSMLSMFENTREKVTVHIMHNDRLTPDNRGKLCYIAGQYNQQVEFHNVEEIAGNTLRKIEEAHPIKSGINAAWYPLIVHEIFPDLDKIIFLGADTIFNLDVAELWAYDLNSECGIAAIPEILNGVPKDFFRIIVDGYVNHEDYFNVDVMILKPAFFKENFNVILNGLKFINDKRVSSNYRHYLANEQDTLSYLFSKNYLKLPRRFNFIMRWKRLFDSPESHRIENAVYHFADPNDKPSFNTVDVYNRLYLEYFLKTPWANVEMFGNIHRATENLFRKNLVNFKKKMLSLTNLLPHCERAFFADKKDFELIKHVFETKENELIIDSSAPDAVNNLLRALNDYRGKKIFFLLIENYWRLAIFLRQNSFVEDKDFFNAVDMLSEQYGIREDFESISRALLQEM